MTQGKLVKVIGYYNDASYIERIVATFRKLLVDIDWIYGRRIDNEGLYEIYLYVKDHPNFEHAVLNLSKTVGVEKVEVCNCPIARPIEIENPGASNIERDANAKAVFILYIPVCPQGIAYNWGEKYGKNIS